MNRIISGKIHIAAMAAAVAAIVFGALTKSIRAPRLSRTPTFTSSSGRIPTALEAEPKPTETVEPPLATVTATPMPKWPLPSYPANCAPDQPWVDIYAERAKVSEGEDVVFTLWMRNSNTLPAMTVEMTMQAPSGWSLDFVQLGWGLLGGEEIADNSSSSCSATYTILPGEWRIVKVVSKANECGDFTFDGRLECRFGDDKSGVAGIARNMQITVEPGTDWRVWLPIGVSGAAAVLALASLAVALFRRRGN